MPEPWLRRKTTQRKWLRKKNTHARPGGTQLLCWRLDCVEKLRMEMVCVKKIRTHAQVGRHCCAGGLAA